MKKRIRVIKINGWYVNRHEYSQGESSYTTTPDPLKAIDLNTYEYNADLLWKCCVVRAGGIVEDYDVTIEKVELTSPPLPMEAKVGYPH